MLRQLRLTRYKGFSEFQISFGDQAFLVGPNNAGKTMIIAALRLCASLLAQARRLRPDGAWEFDGRWYYAYNFAASPLGFIDENVRHEFRDMGKPSIVTVQERCADACRMAYWRCVIVLLETSPGVQPRRPTEVRAAFSTIGVVPILSPIEHDEVVLTSDHIKDNLSSRIVSRHFRNQINLLAAAVIGRLRALPLVELAVGRGLAIGSLVEGARRPALTAVGTALACVSNESRRVVTIRLHLGVTPQGSGVLSICPLVR